MTEHTPEATKAADLKTTLVMAALDVVEHTKEREFAVRIPCTPLEVCVRPIEEKPQRRANDALPAEPLDWGDAADAAAPSYRQLNSGDLMKRLEGYGFRCEGGPLKNCEDWRALRTAVLDRAPQIAAPPAADQQAQSIQQYRIKGAKWWSEALDKETLDVVRDPSVIDQYEFRTLYTAPVAADQQAAGSVEPTDEQIDDWCFDIRHSDHQDEPLAYDRAIARAVLAGYAALDSRAQTEAPTDPTFKVWQAAHIRLAVKVDKDKITDFYLGHNDTINQDQAFRLLGKAISRAQPVSQPVAAGEVPNFRALTAENVQAWAQCADSRPAGGVTDAEFRTCCDHPDCPTCAGRGGFYRMPAATLTASAAQAAPDDEPRVVMVAEPWDYSQITTTLRPDLLGKWRAVPLMMGEGCAILVGNHMIAQFSDYNTAQHLSAMHNGALSASAALSGAEPVIPDERIAELFEEAISYPLEDDDLAGVRLLVKLIAREIATPTEKG